ncbi:MAG: hypothetical protein H0U52_02530 [Chloroflexi bacterium]|nr:hypothetical protein [Chloroflexota bacterium]
MTPPRGPLRIPLLGVALVALIAVVAIPALAAPSSAPGLSAPDLSAPEGSEKPGRGPKASKEPEVAVTLTGVVATTTGAEDETQYTITAAGKTLKLDGGPSWFFGDNHPLKPFVGKNVTIVGGQRGDEVDVETVDGVRLRAEGKPPWAGGWKAVGSAHPGWTQEKADRWKLHLANHPDKAARDAARAAAKAAREAARAAKPDESPAPSP